MDTRRKSKRAILRPASVLLFFVVALALLLALMSAFHGGAQRAGAMDTQGRVDCPDFDTNGDINARDLSRLARQMGTVLGDDRYDPMFDLNKDDRIDSADLRMVVDQLGQMCQAGRIVAGTVCEFPPPSICGALRGATVTLLPKGLQTTTSLDDGTFVFSDVANGFYELTVSPVCTPFGCYGPTAVTVADADVYVNIVPVSPTLTAAPTLDPG